MIIRVKVFASLREFIGEKEIGIELPDSDNLSVMDVVSAFVRIYGESAHEHLFDKKGNLRGIFSFLLNGERVDLSSRVRDGDVLAILPPVAGG